VGGIGDEEDVEAASRAGLGSSAALGGARAAAAAALSARHMMSEPFAGVPADEADAEAEAALREEMAKEEKGKGNRAFAENRVRCTVPEHTPALPLTAATPRARTWQHADAVRHFTACIALDGSNHVYFSNRSAAHAALADWAAAATDAARTTALKPDWAKGWARRGAAAMGQEAFTGAACVHAMRICALRCECGRLSTYRVFVLPRRCQGGVRQGGGAGARQRDVSHGTLACWNAMRR
jgi:hypothetical protein